MTDIVIGAPADKRHVARRELHRALRVVVEPQPPPPPYDGMNRELDRAPQPQPPGGRGHRSSENSARSARSREVVVQQIHAPSIEQESHSGQFYERLKQKTERITH